LRSRKLVVGVGVALSFCGGVAYGGGTEPQEQWANPTATWQEGSIIYCSATKARVANGPYDKGATTAFVYSSTGDVSCALALVHTEKAAGNLKAKAQYYHRDEQSGVWGLCWGSGWEFNDQPGWTFKSYREWQNNQPCGSGRYRTTAFGGVKHDGNFEGDNVDATTDWHNVDG